MRKLIWGLIFILLILLIGYMGLYTLYPISYMDIIMENSREYEVDPYLIASIINVESRYDPLAKSNKEAKGLMQITPSTGQWASQLAGLEEYSEDDLYDPSVNIRLGSWYLKRLSEQFEGDRRLVLAAYNGGSGNVSKWLKDSSYSSDGRTLESIPFKETAEYLDKVEKNYRVYSSVYRGFFSHDGISESKYMSILHKIRRGIDNIKDSD